MCLWAQLPDYDKLKAKIDFAAAAAAAFVGSTESPEKSTTKCYGNPYGAVTSALIRTETFQWTVTVGEQKVSHSNLCSWAMNVVIGEMSQCSKDVMKGIFDK